MTTETLTEFDIIQRYLSVDGLAAQPGRHPGVELGIGDDCALMSVPAGHQLVLSMDLLNEDIHFPATAPPSLVGGRAMAVNLSDLAAMGASPTGFTLGLSLPSVDPAWLADFSQGLRRMAKSHACPLLGGDITGSIHASIGISIQVHGLVKSGQALLRSTAKPGDRVMVSGSLGTAATALQLIQGGLGAVSKEDRSRLEQSYYSPEPRIALGQRLVGKASAAIDISDGLLADLRHIAKASAVQITIQAETVPVSALARRLIGPEAALWHALCGGDDYELVFTVPPMACATVQALAEELGLPITEIGQVTAGTGLLCLDEAGKEMNTVIGGYEHFRS